MSLDTGRAFGTVLTVGAGVVAINMVSRLGETTRNGKSRSFSPMFDMKNPYPKPYSFKPIRWKL